MQGVKRVSNSRSLPFPPRHHAFSLLPTQASPQEFPLSLLSSRSKKKANATPSPPSPQAAVGEGAVGLPVSRRRLIEMTAGWTSFMTLCPCCPSITTPSAMASEGAAPWTYDEPTKWPAACFTGQAQSPVDLPLFDGWTHAKNSAMGELTFEYGAPVKTFPLSISGTGHGTMQVSFVATKPKEGSDEKPPPTPYFSVNGNKYDLIQYHFHTPSEHAFQGKKTSMECHLVHRNRSTGSLAVVGVLLSAKGDKLVTQPNVVKEQPLENIDDCLRACIDLAPPTGAVGPNSINAVGKLGQALWPTSFLPTSKAYVHYQGSLTTPPCSEGVDWFLLANPQAIELETVEDFREYNLKNGGILRGTSGNARPPQNPNLRSLDYVL